MVVTCGRLVRRAVHVVVVVVAVARRVAMPVLMPVRRPVLMPAAVAVALTRRIGMRVGVGKHRLGLHAEVCATQWAQRPRSVRSWRSTSKPGGAKSFIGPGQAWIGYTRLHCVQWKW